jgi:hypothetical protein
MYKKSEIDKFQAVFCVDSFPISKGVEECFVEDSNMTSFIGLPYINHTLIKLTIYFNSHMHIDEQIKNIIPW